MKRQPDPSLVKRRSCLRRGRSDSGMITVLCGRAASGLGGSLIIPSTIDPGLLPLQAVHSRRDDLLRSCQVQGWRSGHQRVVAASRMVGRRSMNLVMQSLTYILGGMAEELYDIELEPAVEAWLDTLS